VLAMTATRSVRRLDSTHGNNCGNRPMQAMRRAMTMVSRASLAAATNTMKEKSWGCAPIRAMA